MFITYIIYSAIKNRFYIGHTGDNISERIRKHNSDHKGFTGGLGDWNLKYSETFSSKELAYKREREIKSWKSRKRVEELIRSVG